MAISEGDDGAPMQPCVRRTSLCERPCARKKARQRACGGRPVDARSIAGVMPAGIEVDADRSRGLGRCDVVFNG